MTAVRLALLVAFAAPALAADPAPVKVNTQSAAPPAEWKSEKPAEAIPSFLNSCEIIAKKKDSDPMGVDGHGGLARQWRKACAAAAKIPAGDNATAKAMFEAEFVPHLAAKRDGQICSVSEPSVWGIRQTTRERIRDALGEGLAFD